MAARRAAALALAALCGAAALDAARAQTAPRYRLAGGGLTSCAGAGSAAGRAVLGEIGSNLATGRSSSESADLIGGIVGRAYSPAATVVLETGEREFASIAFPVEAPENDIESLFEELDEPDRHAWRLGHWSPGDSTYLEAAGGTLEEVEPGQGYFLITAEETEVDASGLTVPIGDFEIELADGPGGRPAWNQLGNPFLFPIAPADLQVTDGAVTVPLLSPANTLTDPAVKLFDPETQAYVTNPPVIESLTAFWVKKVAPGPVTLILPYQVGEEDGGDTPPKPAGARWALALTARQGGRTSEPVVLGTAPVAAGAWNPLCVARAPDPPGGGLGLSHFRPDWGRRSGDYVRVFGPEAEVTSWELDLAGASWPGELTLALEGFDLPAGARISLADAAAGWSRAVAAGSVVTLAARRAQRLRLTVALSGAPAAPVASAEGLRHVHPNPMRQRTGLVFEAREGVSLAGRIFDVHGRHIRDLAAPGGAAGERVVVWDGRDESGRAVPPGVYLARWTAGAARGVARVVKVE